MAVEDSGIPRLEPPGAGIPAYQRLVGRYILLPFYRRRLSWQRAVDLVEKEGRALLRSAEALDEDRLTRRVLVRPQIGLEDSSRYWSYAMLLEHLVIMGRKAADLIVDLTWGRQPPNPVRTADLKPAGELSAAESLNDFRWLLDHFRQRTMEEVGNRDSPTRFEHPWFGPLTVRQWIVFVPFHQRIHIRQAKRILRSLSR